MRDVDDSCFVRRYRISIQMKFMRGRTYGIKVSYELRPPRAHHPLLKRTGEFPSSLMEKNYAYHAILFAGEIEIQFSS